MPRDTLRKETDIFGLNLRMNAEGRKRSVQNCDFRVKVVVRFSTIMKTKSVQKKDTRRNIYIAVVLSKRSFIGKMQLKRPKRVGFQPKGCPAVNVPPLRKSPKWRKNQFSVFGLHAHKMWEKSLPRCFETDSTPGGNARADPPLEISTRGSPNGGAQMLFCRKGSLWAKCS